MKYLQERTSSIDKAKRPSFEDVDEELNDCTPLESSLCQAPKVRSWGVISKLAVRLNNLQYIRNSKLRLLVSIYERVKSWVFEDEELEAFLKSNMAWLECYARRWEANGRLGAGDGDVLKFVAFLQFHCRREMSEVTQCVLSGDFCVTWIKLLLNRFATDNGLVLSCQLPHSFEYDCNGAIGLCR